MKDHLPMSEARVFFSWQSDRLAREGKNLIERALDIATKRISKDLQIEEDPRDPLKLDKDTLDVPGSPPIFDTIRQKIDRAAVFVADLTFVSTRPNGDPSPNPNVLIEYGYALKSLTFNRMVGVMNTTFGEPSRELLPFDLAYYRFPITYCLEEGASDEERKSVREKLGTDLERAIRNVLESEEYKATLPKPEPLPPAKYREPLQGRARFRAEGEPIGFSNDPLQRMLGSQDWPVTLANGAARWLRVMPQHPIEKRLKISDVRQVILVLANAPVYNAHSNTLFARGSDGIGLCMPLDPEPSACLVYVFTDGEIWAIDTFSFKALPKLIQLDELGLALSLKQFAVFLNDHLKIPPPYRWVAGIEGVQGRALPVGNYQSRGPCIADVVEEEGIFNIGDDPAAALEPFFEQVYEQCGVGRSRQK
jgi:hypothetical protein